jgi:hypothetical protein
MTTVLASTYACTHVNGLIKIRRMVSSNKDGEVQENTSKVKKQWRARRQTNKQQQKKQRKAHKMH